MLTLFTIPKPFTDPHIALIQENAIRSWKRLGVEIILMGKDGGVAEMAKKHGVTHIPEIAYNEHGTPRLDAAFAEARETTEHDILMYTNADMVFLADLMDAVKKLPEDNFLAVGRRTDLDIKNDLAFDNPEQLKKKARENGALHSPKGIDYFLFHKNDFSDLPPFAVGRIGWDIWMITHAKEQGLRIVDMTPSVLAIHQNHDYPAQNKGVARKTNPEAKNNLSFLESRSYEYDISDAGWKMAESGLKRNYRWWIPRFKAFIKRLIGR